MSKVKRAVAVFNSYSFSKIEIILTQYMIRKVRILNEMGYTMTDKHHAR